eukprot:90796-Chlamydomonas_euryale.AAC.3
MRTSCSNVWRESAQQVPRTSGNRTRSRTARLRCVISNSASKAACEAEKVRWAGARSGDGRKVWGGRHGRLVKV